MECYFCGQDLTKERSFKKTVAKNSKTKKKESKTFCDGISPHALSQLRISERTFKVAMDEKRIKELSEKGMCVHVYRFLAAKEGFDVVTPYTFKNKNKDN